MAEVKVSEMKSHPKNTFFFDDLTGQKWTEFLESVRTSGVIEPPILTQDKVIVSGHQRIRACKELGIESIQCEIRIYDGEDEVLKQLIETNIRQRGNINSSDMKMGRIIKELERIYGVKQGRGGDTTSNPQVADWKTQDDIAKELNMSVDKLNRFKKLAELPEEYQEMLASGKISTNTAVSLIAKLSEDEQAKLLSVLPSAQKLTQAQIQTEVNKIKSEKEADEKAFRNAIRVKDGMIAEANEKIEMLESVPAGSDPALIAERDELKQKERKEYERRRISEREKKEMNSKLKVLEQEKQDLERRLNKAVESGGGKVVQIAPPDYIQAKEECERLRTRMEELQKKADASAPFVDDKCIRTMGRNLTEEEYAYEILARLNSLFSSTHNNLSFYVREHERITAANPNLDELRERALEEGEALINKGNNHTKIFGVGGQFLMQASKLTETSIIDLMVNITGVT